MSTTLRIYRGDYTVIRNARDELTGVPIPATDINGATLNLTGATIKFKAKVRRTNDDDDTDAIITKTGTVTNGVGGLFEVILEAEDTDALEPQALWWGLQATNTLTQPVTLDSGLLLIKADIVRDVP